MFSKKILNWTLKLTQGWSKINWIKISNGRCNFVRSARYSDVSIIFDGFFSILFNVSGSGARLINAWGTRLGWATLRLFFRNGLKIFFSNNLKITSQMFHFENVSLQPLDERLYLAKCTSWRNASYGQKHHLATSIT